MTAPNDISLDALIPAEMATKAEAIGVKKAHLNPVSMIMLAVLAANFMVEIAYGFIDPRIRAATTGEH